MEHLKTESGLAIAKVTQPDGGLLVRLDEPNGKTFASITFDEVRGQWTWGGSYSTYLTQVIDWADETFAKRLHEEEEERKQQREV